MIAIDTNLLVYAHREDSTLCERARTVLRGLAEGSSAWGVPFHVLVEFVAVVTHPRIYDPPTPLAVALDEVRGLLASPTVRVLVETEESWEGLARVASAAGALGARMHDARIAALCVETGVRELLSVDRDFSRFSEVRVRNPLM